MRFTNEFIEEVRDRNDIVDVIGSYVKLEHKGSSYKGLCPFHSEKTPSFIVNRNRQTYHCFGCGKSGDVFSFLMEYERNTFYESVENLAKRAGMEIPASSYSEQSKDQRALRDRILEIHKEAAKYYFCALYTPGAKHALDYLRKRGLDDNIIRHFGLGYSDRTGSSLYRYLKEKGYSDADLKETGIFNIDESKGRVRDRFWNRVMFPIMDQNRRVIGFGGRVIGDAQPKYLNSPETKIFDKSRNLYGLHLARSTRKKYLILCEGYMDVIALHSAGFDNAVASLGTALTAQQCTMIKRYAKEAVLLYDSDGAGIKAARRAIPLLREAGIHAKVANMQPHKDPDEFIKALGAEEMQKRIDHAENGFMFEIRQQSLEYDLADPQGMADFRNAVVTSLLVFTDEIERNSYTESVAREYGIDKDVLKRQIAKRAMGARAPVKEVRPADPAAAREDPGLKTERLMLSMMSRGAPVTKKACKYLSEYDFTTDLHRELFKALSEMAESGRFSPVSILNRYDEPDQKSAAAAVIENAGVPEDEKEREVAVNEVLTALKNRTYERSLKNATQNDPEQLQHFLEEKIRLEKLKADLKGTGEN